MEFDSIFQIQQAAYLDGALEPYQCRMDILLKFEKVFKKYSQDLCSALVLDLHKSQRQSELSEIEPVIHELNYFKKNLKFLMKPQKVKQSLIFKNTTSQLIPRPIGPSLIISPFNYPVNLAFVPLIGAFAAGCPVTLKGSPQTPNILKVFELIAREFPDKLFCFFMDHTQLLPRPFSCVFFTGSIPVAKIIQAQCAQYLNRCVLELGGVNPVFLGKCNKKQASYQISLGKFFNAGQTCIAPNFICVTPDTESVVNDIIKIVEQKFKTNEHICKIISKEKYAYLEDVVKTRKIIYQHSFLDKENLIYPITLIEVDKTDELLTQELFGNVLPIVKFKSLNDQIQWYRETFYVPNLQCRPLAAYLFTDMKQEKEYFMRNISAGALSINQVLLYQISQLPFGGVGQSGIGNYHGIETFKVFSHYQPLLWVQKHKMFGLGYAINSFVANSTLPPMRKNPEFFMKIGLNLPGLSFMHNVKIISLVFLVLWALGTTAGLIYLLVK
ncbi:Aldehyde dehydrogenase [Spironucleus salmonicida]|uniref:Aldehyde dehydrogenase n=1 Tax=Spironucleus salmonicida TaxID=348837 RepID=V6LGG5_9EUKA|nr:Aldehyde dehydrogenase [Spironucleus salmonicida]|eukprot:EST43388.1 Aldehyde dehydrogenase [Spironucleus salmonicida]